ncbi:MAG: hypothetical protein ACP5MV_02465 [Candidatus Parvarchaeum sp.]
MEDELKLWIRRDLSDILKLILNNKKEGLAYVHAIIDSGDFDYKTLDRNNIDNRKYGLEHVLLNISKVLHEYTDECDRMSFGYKKSGETREYFVRPFMQYEVYEALSSVIDDISEMYQVGFENNDLYPVRKKNRKDIERQRIKRLVQDIIDTEAEYDFVSNLEDTVNYNKTVRSIDS